jgi:hypothetical protein
MIFKKRLYFLLSLAMLFATNIGAQNKTRTDIELKKGWLSVADDNDSAAYKGFEFIGYKTATWQKVEVPHNWDVYNGYRRLRHGNRHGYAWYRNSFVVNTNNNKRIFLWFEGVGSYATVWVNGKKAGYHAGGRTGFTLDVTDAINKNGKPNLLAVRADHPANIKDLPWVCGACSDERGFSEGSQPMGIFRPVHIIATNVVRVEPLGVYVWSNDISTQSANIHSSIEIKNYAASSKKIVIKNFIVDASGKKIISFQDEKNISSTQTIKSTFIQKISNPVLWSLDNPYLYTLVTALYENEKLVDKIETSFGIKTISWQIGKNQSHQFLLNGKPVFINGIAEYEHLLGGSHAFSEEEIKARTKQIFSLGFNAFRDAHQPHNLRYQQYWDKQGMLWWPQFSAHVWYDSPAFRNNFKTLLIDWIKERRNSPSIILWGLQNESKLPKDFAEECVALIHQLDSTSSSQIKITTCNGGEGTDWDVPQNWTGTYGGNPDEYDKDLKKQLLVGEYGAWRTLDLHNNKVLVQNGKYSEDDMVQLIEKKIQKAERVKDSVCGHFFWLYNSHDNPGRIQGGEAMREIDRVGPVNYKGLVTPWGEPADAYYLFKSYYASRLKEPMLYIVSHTWPDRWLQPGIKDSIAVYSNCDEVELFNDINHISLGRQKKKINDNRFVWNNVNVQYNVLYAVAYINEKVVATDKIVLHHLPQAPHFNSLINDAKITEPQKGLHYVYRVNCGGAQYTDAFNNVWDADRNLSSNNCWGSVSWASAFSGAPFSFASQRNITEPIANTKDWKLFQSFRYGREQLKYHFPVPNGNYFVELYFIEPWLGRTGEDATAERLFDVAINNNIIIKNIDIWKEAGYANVLKKIIPVKVVDGKIDISFPHVAVGQAVISAIAVSTENKTVWPMQSSTALLQTVLPDKNISVEEWLNTGDHQFTDSKISFSALPANLYGATWLCSASSLINAAVKIKITQDADVFVAVNAMQGCNPLWMQDFADTKTIIQNNQGTVYKVFRKRMNKNTMFVAGVNANIIIAAIPVSNIEPAYDIKEPVNYAASNAIINNNIIKENFAGKTAIHFTQNSIDTAVIVFETGVADTYSLTLKYANPTNAIVNGTIQLVDIAGHILREEKIEFATSRPGKWNLYEGSTGTMINAGKYFYKIISNNAQGLFVSGLEVR